MMTKKRGWKPFTRDVFMKSVCDDEWLVIHQSNDKSYIGKLTSFDANGVWLRSGFVSRNVEFAQAPTSKFFCWLEPPEIEISTGDAKLI